MSSPVADAIGRIDAADSVAALRELESELLGKSSSLAARQKALGALAPEERKEAGRALYEERAALQAAVDARLATLGAAERAVALEGERLDLTEILPGPPPGRTSLVQRTREELEDLFIGLGYAIAEGPLVDTDYHCFDALNIPPSHPARSGFDSLYVQWGAPESTLLRPHTSPVQIRVMEVQPPPIYIVAPGQCYRKDTPDARHLPAFNQIEGLVVDRGITFGDLAGTIQAFTTGIFGPGMQSRLRPAYFGFTEPSGEFEVTCAVCKGDGCRTCSGTGWIELGGCGMVHPNVFAAVGLDPEEWTGFAFGFGIDRIAQVRHALPDMRVLLDDDLRFMTAI